MVKFGKRLLSLVTLMVFLCSSWSGLVLSARASEVTDKIDAVIEAMEDLRSSEAALERCEVDMATALSVVDEALGNGLSEDSAIVFGARQLYGELAVRRMDLLSAVATLRQFLRPYSEYVTMEYLGVFRITNYCGGSCCNGKWAGYPTASGAPLTEGLTCAADPSIPFGTKLYIENVGYRIVQDRGTGISGMRLDIYCGSHKACFTAPWGGRSDLKVYLVKGEV